MQFDALHHSGCNFIHFIILEVISFISPLWMQFHSLRMHFNSVYHSGCNLIHFITSDAIFITVEAIILEAISFIPPLRMQFHSLHQFGVNFIHIINPVAISFTLSLLMQIYSFYHSEGNFTPNAISFTLLLQMQFHSLYHSGGNFIHFTTVDAIYFTSSFWR